MTNIKVSTNRVVSAVDRRVVAITRWIYVVSAVLTGAAVVSKANLISSVIPVPAVLIALLVAVASLVPIFFTRILRHARLVAPVVVIGVWVVAVGIQPGLLTRLHDKGRGTDQGDCIAIGASRLVHGEWPYARELMWSKNPMSCGPGWLGLHSPFDAINGYPTAMAMLFTIGIAVVFFVYDYSTAARFVTLMGIAPGFWLSYANGNDFVTFGVLVVAVVALMASPLRIVRMLGVFTAVLVSQFRAPFVLLPAVSLRRVHPDVVGRQRLVPLCAATVSVLVFAVFYVWDADAMVSDGPLHILEKFIEMIGLSGGGPVVAILFVAAVAVVAALASRFEEPFGTLIYCSAFLIPLSLASLISSLASAASVTGLLERWEGVSWLTSLVCIAAGVLVLHRRAEPLGPRQPAATDMPRSTW